MGAKYVFCITTVEDFVFRKSIWKCFFMLLGRVDVSWLNTA